MWLIVFFSLGIAPVLAAIGLVVVVASGKLRRFAGEENKWLEALPVFPSSMIALLGFLGCHLDASPV